MSASAIALAAAGLPLTFLPHELLSYLQAAPVELLAIGVQLLGALYLSFAMLNWMAKANLIGGIYSKPVAIGNFLHFFMGATLFAKAAASGTWGAPMWALCIVYSGFALLFGLVLLRHPVRQHNKVAGTKTA